MAEPQKSSIFRTPGLGIVAGSVVGVAIVVGMTLGGFFQHEETATKIPTPQAAIDFIEAYGDSLNADFMQKRERRRVLVSGQSSVSDSVLAQLDGDSVVIAGGNITTVKNDERFSCPIEPDGAITARCPAPQPFNSEDATDQQIRGVEQLVDEEDGAYNVASGDNQCFQLSLTSIGLAQDPAELPWGNRAEFCFDTATEALRSARIERDGGADAITSTYLSADVNQAVLDRLARGDQSDFS